MASSSNSISRQSSSESVIFVDHLNAGNESPQNEARFDEFATYRQRGRHSTVSNRSRVDQHQNQRKRKNNDYESDNDDEEEQHHVIDEEKDLHRLEEQEHAEEHEEEEDTPNSSDEEQQESRRDKRIKNQRTSEKRPSTKQHSFQCNICKETMKYSHNYQPHVAKCLETVLKPEQDKEAKKRHADLFESIADAGNDPTIPLPDLPTDSNGIVVLDLQISGLHFPKYPFQLP